MGIGEGFPRRALEHPLLSIVTLVMHLVMDDHHVTVVCAQPSVHGLTDAADFVQGGSVVVGPAKVQHLRDNTARKSDWSSDQPRSDRRSTGLPLDWVDRCRSAFRWGWRAKRKQTKRKACHAFQYLLYLTVLLLLILVTRNVPRVEIMFTSIIVGQQSECLEDQSYLRRTQRKKHTR